MAENWVYVPPEQRRLIGDDAIAQFVNRNLEAFVEYVIDEAKTPIYAEQFNMGAVRDAVMALSNDGYDLGEKGHITPVCFAHPKEYDSFAQSLPPTYGPDDLSGDGIKCYGVKVSPDSAIPENRVVCVHPSAIAPNIPGHRSYRPWVVMDGKGIAIIEIHE